MLFPSIRGRGDGELFGAEMRCDTFGVALGRDTDIDSRGPSSLQEFSTTTEEPSCDSSQGKPPAEAAEAVPGQPNRFYVYILTTAGKTAYACPQSRAGGPEIIEEHTDALNSMIAKFGLFAPGKPSPNAPRSVSVGGVHAEFLLVGSLVLAGICVGSRIPRSQTAALLSALQRQVLSAVSTGVQQTLAENPNFELGPLLSDSLPALDGLVEWSCRSTHTLVAGLEALPVQASVRNLCTESLRLISTPHIAFALLICQHRVVSFLCYGTTPQSAPSPGDLKALVVYILSAVKGKSSAWFPFCFPDLHEKEIYHIYSHYLDNLTNTAVVFASRDENDLISISEQMQQKLSSFEATSIKPELRSAAQRCPIAIPQRVSEALGVLHLAYYDTERQQSFSSDVDGEVRRDPRLLRTYISRYHACKEMLEKSGPPSHVTVFNEVVTHAVSSPAFELYMTLNGNSEPKVAEIDRIVAWVRSQLGVLFQPAPRKRHPKFFRGWSSQK